MLLGCVVTWDVSRSSPGRSLTAVLGQHKSPIWSLKFWQQPNNSNIDREKGKIEGLRKGGGTKTTHLISGGGDGSVCFFDMFETPKGSSSRLKDFRDDFHVKSGVVDIDLLEGSDGCLGILVCICICMYVHI
jgi:hypothetical protein